MTGAGVKGGFIAPGLFGETAFPDGIVTVLVVGIGMVLDGLGSGIDVVAGLRTGPGSVDGVRIGGGPSDGPSASALMRGIDGND